MKKCSICESTQYEAFDFKNGRICEDCLDYIKAGSEDDHSECSDEE